jgi:hypothetical protein
MTQPPAAENPAQGAPGVSRRRGFSDLALDAKSLVAARGFRAFAVALLVTVIGFVARDVYYLACDALAPLVGLHPT